MSDNRIEVLSPVAVTDIVARTPVAPLPTLENKVIAYHHARGPYLGVVAFAEKLSELLVGRYGLAGLARLKSVVDNHDAVDDGAAGWSDPKLKDRARRVYDAYAQQVDCVIVGAAFCGGSTYWSIQAAAELQDRGVPTLSLTCPAFHSLALYTCRARGYTELPMLILPDEFETMSEMQMHEIAEERVHEVAAILATGATVMSSAS
jgi:hypothetical protein